MKQILLLLGLISLFLTSCGNDSTSNTNITKVQQPAPAPFKTTTVQLDKERKIMLLDSTAAAIAVIKDDKEDFFDKISIIDMSVQMKQNYPKDTDREQVLKDYKKFLQKDISDFTEEEATFVKEAFYEAYERCKVLNINTFPKNIRLIKTKGRYYGPSVYYTREDAIVIPANVLVERNLASFTDVMLHEIFHIYSRYDLEKQKELYALIGFRTLEKLDIPEPLAKRLLLNPDGVNYAQGIELNQQNATFTAVPLIVSISDYRPQENNYFDYISFNLYVVEKTDKNSYKVRTESGYKSIIKYRQISDFNRQIGDNTDYIIHPDEVLADNFVLVVNQKNGIDLGKTLSKEGQKLLQKIETVLIK